MFPEGYQKKELTMGGIKANLYSLVFLVPVLLVFYLPFSIIWSYSINLDSFSMIIREHGLLFFGLLVSGIFVHELIHGITWALFAKNGFRSISFGFNLKVFSPYCHCKEVLEIGHYRKGTIMPGIITGVLPSIVGILTGNLIFLLSGIILTMAAGSDFLFIWLLRKEAKDSLVLDHPDELGCFIYSPKK